MTWLRSSASHGKPLSVASGSVMVPPPWHLVSPTGATYVVTNAEALKELAKSTPGLIDSSRTNLLAILVGAGHDSKALADLPLHKKNWQLRQRVEWIQRIDAPAIILPIIGGDGTFFVNTFFAHRDAAEVDECGQSGAPRVSHAMADPRVTASVWRRLLPPQGPFLKGACCMRERVPTLALHLT
jgi:hypothetical protein